MCAFIVLAVWMYLHLIYEWDLKLKEALENSVSNNIRGIFNVKDQPCSLHKISCMLLLTQNDDLYNDAVFKLFDSRKLGLTL